ncbi:hypothetical protein [Raineyella fluvialis]|uniref:Uncharacterized protein n=1 Tax=Raineyella fluvialis TaxID=2662261 RepID=A0A5Q2F7B4_9ACTN|nr:hypothetical protein [Raineyella fluvialis]QGF22371.1 hypothetical protein Rai3103_00230 [Raineyella fluvialis]
MSDLVTVIAPLTAGLVPLDNLPGWPQAPAVPLVHELVWILFLPAAVFIVIAVIQLASMIGKEDRSLHPPTEPLMIGGSGRQTPAVTSGSDTEEGAGGSHAHW